MSMLSRFAAMSSVKSIDYVGGHAATVTASTTDQVITFGGNLTGGLASSASAGDLVLVHFATGTTVDRNLVVSGYTEITEQYANDTLDINFVVAYKFMGATPDTTVTLTGGTLNTADGGSIVIQVFRGVDTNLVQDTAPVVAATLNTALVNPGAITPNTLGAIIVASGGAGHARGASQTYSSTDLTNFRSAGSGNVTNDSSVGAGYKVWSGGPFDPAAWTWSAADSAQYSYGACTMALRPARTNPPTYVNVSAVAEVTGTSLVLDKPTNTADGDIMVAFIYADAGVTVTPPSGWNEVLDSNTVSSTNAYAAHKTASSEGASYTFTLSSSANATGFIITYRNAVYDTVGAVNASTQAASITVSDYAVVLYFAADDNTALASASLAGWTERVRSALSLNSVACYEQYDYAGATGTVTAITTTGTAKELSFLLSLKPA